MTSSMEDSSAAVNPVRATSASIGWVVAERLPQALVVGVRCRSHDCSCCSAAPSWSGGRAAAPRKALGACVGAVAPAPRSTSSADSTSGGAVADQPVAAARHAGCGSSRARANTSRPASAASRAVISAPERIAASTTSVPSAQPGDDAVALREMLAPVARCPGGCSLTTAPRRGDPRQQRGVAARDRRCPVPVPSTATVGPPAASAPRCAAVSMPAARPLATHQPRRAKARAKSCALSRPPARRRCGCRRSRPPGATAARDRRRRTRPAAGWRCGAAAAGSRDRASRAGGGRVRPASSRARASAAGRAPAAHGSAPSSSPCARQLPAPAASAASARAVEVEQAHVASRARTARRGAIAARPRCRRCVGAACMPAQRGPETTTAP